MRIDAELKGRGCQEGCRSRGHSSYNLKDEQKLPRLRRVEKYVPGRGNSTETQG